MLCINWIKNQLIRTTKEKPLVIFRKHEIYIRWFNKINEMVYISPNFRKIFFLNMGKLLCWSFELRNIKVFFCSCAYRTPCIFVHSNNRDVLMHLMLKIVAQKNGFHLDVFQSVSKVLSAQLKLTVAIYRQLHLLKLNFNCRSVTLFLEI